MLIEHYLTLSVFQQYHAVDGGHSSHVCGTFLVDCSGKVGCHHAARIILAIAAERPGQHVVVCFIDVTQRATRIINLIHICIDFLVQIVEKALGVNPNGLSNTIRPGRMFLRGFLRCSTHFRK